MTYTNGNHRTLCSLFITCTVVIASSGLVQAAAVQPSPQRSGNTKLNDPRSEFNSWLTQETAQSSPFPSFVEEISAEVGHVGPAAISNVNVPQQMVVSGLGPERYISTSSRFEQTDENRTSHVSNSSPNVKAAGKVQQAGDMLNPSIADTDDSRDFDSASVLLKSNAREMNDNMKLLGSGSVLDTVRDIMLSEGSDVVTQGRDATDYSGKTHVKPLTSTTLDPENKNSGFGTQQDKTGNQFTDGIDEDRLAILFDIKKHEQNELDSAEARLYRQITSRVIMDRNDHRNRNGEVFARFRPIIAGQNVLGKTKLFLPESFAQGQNGFHVNSEGGPTYLQNERVDHAERDGKSRETSTGSRDSVNIRQDVVNPDIWSPGNQHWPEPEGGEVGLPGNGMPRYNLNLNPKVHRVSSRYSPKTDEVDRDERYWTDQDTPLSVVQRVHPLHARQSQKSVARKPKVAKETNTDERQLLLGDYEFDDRMNQMNTTSSFLSVDKDILSSIEDFPERRIRFFLVMKRKMQTLYDMFKDNMQDEQGRLEMADNRFTSLGNTNIPPPRFQSEGTPEKLKRGPNQRARARLLKPIGRYGSHKHWPSVKRSFRPCNSRVLNVKHLLEFFLTGKMCGTHVVRMRFGIGRR